MSAAEFEYGDLPADLQGHLEQLCADLRSASGDNLVSVAVYGSVVRAKADDAAGKSVPILVVLQDASIQQLSRIAELLKDAGETFLAAPFVVSLHDLQTSTDIFPIKFLDMQNHHVLLSGRDVLSELEISTQHLRLRCEQELCNLLLRLRQIFLRNVDNDTTLLDAAKRSIPSFFADLATAVSLKTELLPDSETDIADSAAQVMSLDRAALGRVLKLNDRRPVADSAEIAKLFSELLDLVEKAADFVDRLEPESSSTD